MKCECKSSIIFPGGLDYELFELILMDYGLEAPSYKGFVGMTLTGIKRFKLVLFARRLCIVENIMSTATFPFPNFSVADCLSKKCCFFHNLSN